MFPIRDHNPSGRTPYVVYVLMALNIGIFLMYVPILNQPQNLGALFHRWALIPSEVSNGSDPFGIFTSMFLHAGWIHLAGNMLFLWVFGDNLEDILGHAGFALFYVLCGVVAGLAQVISEPFSQVPTVGASGAIAGIMGGYLLLFPKARVDVIVIFIIFFKIFPMPAWIMLGLWFLWQIFSGVITDTSGGGVAYWAHAGGFVAGVILTLPAWLKRGGTEFWQQNKGAPPHPGATYPLSRSGIPIIRRRK